MLIKECIDKNLFTKINDAFSFYALSIDSEKYPDAELWDDADIALLTYKHDFGGLIASDLAEDYKKEDVTAEQIAKMFKLKYFRNWLALYDLDNAKYNPLWNVEGTEKRTVTSEQLEDGHNNTTHGKVQTSKQDTNSTTKQKEYGYNSDDPEMTSEVEMDGGQTSLTDSGTTNIDISDGKKHTIDILERGGNIGVTKTTEMFMDQQKLLKSWNFIQNIFYDMNKELTYLIWEV